MIKILLTLALVCSLTQSYFVPPTQFGNPSFLTPQKMLIISQAILSETFMRITKVI